MQDRGLRFANSLLRFANWVNWFVAAAFVVSIAASFAFGDAFTAHLIAKYSAGSAEATIAMLRIIAVIGIVAAAAMHQIFAALSAITATVQVGDPFVVVNADRLRRIGWALLTLQLLDVGIGLVVFTLDKIGVEHATWTPAFAGWIAVVMVFVLERVFRVGAEMRDDLAMTV